MSTEQITRLEDVRPGDIYVGPIGGLVGVGVGVGEFLIDGGFHVGPLDVRHVGIVVQAATIDTAPDWPPRREMLAPKLAQAMPGGAEIIDMTYDQHWSPKCAYVRIPEDYPGQAADAAEIARLMVSTGVAYSFGSYAALAAWHWGLSTPKLEAWIGRRREPISISCKCEDPNTDHLQVSLPVEAICSVFADQAWSLTGKKIMTGVPHQCVTPSTLGQRLLTMPDAVWGWPSAHPYPYPLKGAHE